MTDPRPTKAQRRDEARLEAQRMRQAEERAAARRRTILIAGIVVAIGVLAVLVTVILGQGARTAMEDVDRPAGSTLAGGIPVGADGIAGAVDDYGDAVVVQVYSDYLCGACAAFKQERGAELDELRESGEIVLEVHPVSILDQPVTGSVYSTRSAAAAALVADESPEAFLAFNDALFDDRPQGPEGHSDERIAEIAQESGASAAVVQSIADGTYYEAAGGEGRFVPWVAAATEQASRDLARLATPTVVVDGQILDAETFDWRVDGSIAQAVAQARADR
ncbi:DsbA family protein [Cellulomonas bogoriensis]|uniref:DSBA oxidoreductase n=1 Tax=Cellulomonas bogoriensis 69B4 = DSM 16987 TaxID=1386082 RepID=A0A0A0BNG0_9CELL|nr:thioredoxin domain-containing protein [Cellulomonas bogoriensis]KGM08604.1 DSBA oxidoreductase [Cellulomonas bogoriensis 69B4 = DSM 16987]